MVPSTTWIPHSPSATWNGWLPSKGAARRAVAGLPLDTIFVSERWGQMSLRWALLQMIAEYAAHSGQADLIRERIDGKKGW
jgi:Protein of unknown function (DUF664)